MKTIVDLINLLPSVSEYIKSRIDTFKFIPPMDESVTFQNEEWEITVYVKPTNDSYKIGNVEAYWTNDWDEDAYFTDEDTIEFAELLDKSL